MNTPPELYAAACERMRLWYPCQDGACLYWAHATMRALRDAGLRPKLQAGSMSWPIVPPEMDDGVSATHFSYIWSPDTAESLMAIACGRLPEMHVWVGLPDSNELVDFSTGGFRRLATKRHGLIWRAPDPPPFVWGAPPPRAFYAADLDAIGFALATLGRATSE